MERYRCSLRNLVWRFKNHHDFNVRMSSMIFRWAKYDSLELWEFAFLIKKAFNYLNKYKK